MTEVLGRLEGSTGRYGREARRNAEAMESSAFVVVSLLLERHGVSLDWSVENAGEAGEAWVYATRGEWGVGYCDLSAAWTMQSVPVLRRWVDDQVAFLLEQVHESE